MKRNPLFVLPKIDVQVITQEFEQQQQQLGKLENEFSIGDTTYRHDGLSIGQDYLRVEGTTITRGALSLTSLSLEETIGRGAFSKVQRAVWKISTVSSSTTATKTNRTTIPHNNDEDKENGKTQQLSTPSTTITTQDVAIKQYPIVLGSTCKQKRQMLIQELRSLCQVDCPCLVKLHGAFLVQDTVTMVLEYMDRGSLEHVLEKRQQQQQQQPFQLAPFSQPMVAGIAYQLLLGLEHLHNQRILHRDVKTENCLLHSNGLVKLCDFGIAAIMGQSASSSMNKTVVGTTKFMAPERLRAKPYGRSSDIWSLGLVLRHVATGEKPWHTVTTSMVELLVTVEETSVEELLVCATRNHNIILEGGLKEILTSCLQLSPSKRMPASMLLRSPWFSKYHGIQSCRDAANRIVDEER